MRAVGLLLVLGTLAVGALAGCASGIQNLEATVSAQGQRMARLEATVVAVSSRPTSAPPSMAVPAVPTPAAVAPVPAATSDPLDRSAAGQTRFVANTEGQGTRVRAECSAESQQVGAWPDGTSLTIEYTKADCKEWLMVRKSPNEAGWVRAEYLSTTAPPRAAAE